MSWSCLPGARFVARIIYGTHRAARNLSQKGRTKLTQCHSLIP
jgi:hypothetical protein